MDYKQRMAFNRKIDVFHLAVVNIHAPSDECGPHGMRREYIWSHPSWYGTCMPWRDTVFVVTDDNRHSMEGMLIARIHLFFSYYDEYLQMTVPCALVNWFVPADEVPDEVTCMWTVKPEVIAGQKPLQVIHLEAIA